MKAGLVISLLTVMTNIYALSFEEVIETLLDKEETFSNESLEISWNEIKVKGSPLVAILEEEIKDLNSSVQYDLAQDRADQICRWIGFEKAKFFKLQDRHAIFKFQTRWYLLRDNSGEFPSWEDLEPVEMAPNAQQMTVSFINNLVKIYDGHSVTLRHGSPKSFQRICCQR